MWNSPQSYCALRNVTYDHRVDDPDRYNWCAVPGGGSDAVLFASLALVVTCAATSKLSAVYVLIAGAAYEVFAFTFNLGHLSNAITIWLGMRPAEIFLIIFLPPLLLDSAVRMDYFLFRKMIWHVMAMAFLMVALTAALLVPVMLYALNLVAEGWRIVDVLLFGSILGATDAISVGAVLSAGGAPKLLSVLLEGESLLNDSAGIVFFTLFLKLAEDKPHRHRDHQGGVLSSPLGSMVSQSLPLFGLIGVGAEGSVLQQVVDGALKILWLAAAGGFAGYITGLCTRYAFHWFHYRGLKPITEVTLTLALAYLTYYLTETYLGGSGVIAVVVFGLYGNATLTWGISAAARKKDVFFSFWDSLAYAINGLVFFFVGAAAVNFFIRTASVLTEDAGITGAIMTTALRLPLIFLGLFLLRGLILSVMMPLLAYFNPTTALTWQGLLFATVGGLRGGISLVLTQAMLTEHISERHHTDQEGASLPDRKRDIVKAQMSLWVTCIVLMTLVINAPLLEPLMSWLKLNKITKAHIYLRQAAAEALLNHTADCLASLRESGDVLMQGVDWDLVSSLVDLKGVIEDCWGTRLTDKKGAKGGGPKKRQSVEYKQGVPEVLMDPPQSFSHEGLTQPLLGENGVRGEEGHPGRQESELSGHGVEGFIKQRLQVQDQELEAYVGRVRSCLFTRFGPTHDPGEQGAGRGAPSSGLVPPEDVAPPHSDIGHLLQHGPGDEFHITVYEEVPAGPVSKDSSRLEDPHPQLVKVESFPVALEEDEEQADREEGQGDQIADEGGQGAHPEVKDVPQCALSGVVPSSQRGECPPTMLAEAHGLPTAHHRSVSSMSAVVLVDAVTGPAEHSPRGDEDQGPMGPRIISPSILPEVAPTRLPSVPHHDQGLGPLSPVSAQTAPHSEVLAALRIKIIGSLKKYFHQEHIHGLLSSKGLRILDYACQEALDSPDQELDLWSIVEREIVRTNIRYRAKVHFLLSRWIVGSRRYGLPEVLVSPLRHVAHWLEQRLNRALMKSLEVAIKLYVALHSTPQKRWLMLGGAAGKKLADEVRQQASRVWRFIMDREIEAPEVFWAVQMYRAELAVLGQQLLFLEHMEEDGLLEENEYESVLSVLRKRIKRLEHWGPRYRPPRLDDLLRRVPFLKDIPEEVFEWVRAYGELRVVEPGQWLVWEGGAIGDNGDRPYIPHSPGLFMVINGVVRLHTDDQHRASEPQYIGPGGVVGLLATLLDGHADVGDRVVAVKAEGNALGHGPLVFYLSPHMIPKIFQYAQEEGGEGYGLLLLNLYRMGALCLLDQLAGGVTERLEVFLRKSLKALYLQQPQHPHKADKMAARLLKCTDAPTDQYEHYPHAPGPLDHLNMEDIAEEDPGGPVRVDSASDGPTIFHESLSEVTEPGEDPTRPQRFRRNSSQLRHFIEDEWLPTIQAKSCEMMANTKELLNHILLNPLLCRLYIEEKWLPAIQEKSADMMDKTKEMFKIADLVLLQPGQHLKQNSTMVLLKGSLAGVSTIKRKTAPSKGQGREAPPTVAQEPSGPLPVETKGLPGTIAEFSPLKMPDGPADKGPQGASSSQASTPRSWLRWRRRRSHSQQDPQKSDNVSDIDLQSEASQSRAGSALPSPRSSLSHAASQRFGEIAGREESREDGSAQTDKPPPADEELEVLGPGVVAPSVLIWMPDYLDVSLVPFALDQEMMYKAGPMGALLVRCPASGWMGEDASDD